MKLHNEEMKQVKSELEMPALNQAQSKFRPEDRFAIILANEFYSKKYIDMILCHGNMLQILYTK